MWKMVSSHSCGRTTERLSFVPPPNRSPGIGSCLKAGIGSASSNLVLMTSSPLPMPRKLVSGGWMHSPQSRSVFVEHGLQLQQGASGTTV